jgi:drug/metabolite transporter (DMT)-like permease
LPQAPLTAEESADRLRGIALLCLSVMTFTLLDTSAKYAAHFVPTLEIVWARYALSLLFAAVVLRPWRDLAAYVTHRPVVQTARALFLLGSTSLNFIAIQYLQLSETVSITFAMPLIVTAFAGPVLGEWAGPRRWAAVIVGFVGVIVVVHPSPATFQPAALLSVCAAFCNAGYALTTRSLSATDSSEGMLIYGSLLATILLAPPIPFVAVMPPTWLVAGALVMTGLMGGIGHWWLILANRYAPATVLAPFNYTQIVWMVLSGYLAFGDIPDATTLIGAAIIIASGLYILYRDQVHRDRRSDKTFQNKEPSRAQDRHPLRGAPARPRAGVPDGGLRRPSDRHRRAAGVGPGEARRHPRHRARHAFPSRPRVP